MLLRWVVFVVGLLALVVVGVLGLVRDVVLEQTDAIAHACSIDRDALRSRLDSGITVQEIAAEHGVDAEQVVAQTMRRSRHRWLRWLSRRTNWGALGLR